MEDVPVLDLASNVDREVQIETIDAALRQFGFFYVCNHGIDARSIQAQFNVAKKLFDLPLEEKQAMPFDHQLDIGYVGCGAQNLDPSIASTDTKEQFMQTNNVLITASDDTSSDEPLCINENSIFEGSRSYKPNVPMYEQVTSEYAGQAFRLNKKLNDLLFEALGLDEETSQALGERPFLVLKQMKYKGELSDPSKGKFGAGAHTDWGSFTILATDTTPGLQIYKDNQWLPVPPRPGCLIINSGDQIAHLTNDYYKSAMHRVVTTTTKTRFSTAVFTYFSMDVKVGPLPKFVSSTPSQKAKYPTRTTKEYFHFKLHESMGVMVAAGTANGA